MKFTERPAYEPKDLLKILPDWCRDARQQDAFEFGRLLLDIIDGELKGTSKADLVKDVFGGRICSTVTCHGCGTVSSRKEDFRDLCLAFPSSAHDNIAPENPIPVEELLRAFFAAESLTGENRYHCNVCGTLQDAHKTASVVAAPDHLIVTLNRFSYNLKAITNHLKLLTPVAVPEELSIPVGHLSDQFGATRAAETSRSVGSSHEETLPSGSSSASPEAEEAMDVDSLHEEKLSKNRYHPSLQQGEGEKVVETTTMDVDSSHEETLPNGVPREVSYHLYGMIVHSGASAQHGHYFTVATDLADDLKGQWLLLNDSIITTVPSFSALSLSAKSTETPYILFYRRSHMPSSRSTTTPAPQHVLEHVLRDNDSYRRERTSRSHLTPLNQVPRPRDDRGPDPNGGGSDSMGGSSGNGLPRFVF